jgi:hypothetical protein
MESKTIVNLYYLNKLSPFIFKIIFIYFFKKKSFNLKGKGLN